eukprot:TRINITY_DN17548_c0_g1_i5.p1 TRINITY_DN17548_c0_g1~~TRINITY_DN17548_c0_g1_i5.p1  ORF type:complete len:826 (+),score=180.67 TRINITY_DN17548_c0_g1_i5:102-2579(+)
MVAPAGPATGSAWLSALSDSRPLRGRRCQPSEAMEPTPPRAPGPPAPPTDIGPAAPEARRDMPPGKAEEPSPEAGAPRRVNGARPGGADAADVNGSKPLPNWMDSLGDQRRLRGRPVADRAPSVSDSGTNGASASTNGSLPDTTPGKPEAKAAAPLSEAPRAPPTPQEPANALSALATQLGDGRRLRAGAATPPAQQTAQPTSQIAVEQTAQQNALPAAKPTEQPTAAGTAPPEQQQQRPPSHTSAILAQLGDGRRLRGGGASLHASDTPTTAPQLEPQRPAPSTAAEQPLSASADLAALLRLPPREACAQPSSAAAAGEGATASQPARACLDAASASAAVTNGDQRTLWDQWQSGEAPPIVTNGQQRTLWDEWQQSEAPPAAAVQCNGPCNGQQPTVWDEWVREDWHGDWHSRRGGDADAWKAAGGGVWQEGGGGHNASSSTASAAMEEPRIAPRAASVDQQPGFVAPMSPMRATSEKPDFGLGPASPSPPGSSQWHQSDGLGPPDAFGLAGPGGGQQLPPPEGERRREMKQDEAAAAADEEAFSSGPPRLELQASAEDMATSRTSRMSEATPATMENSETAASGSGSRRSGRERHAAAAVSSSGGAKVIIVRAWKPVEEGDCMEVAVDDVVRLTQAELSGFFKGTNQRSGKSGWFPVGTVSTSEELLPPDAMPEEAELHLEDDEEEEDQEPSWPGEERSDIDAAALAACYDQEHPRGQDGAEALRKEAGGGGSSTPKRWERHKDKAEQAARSTEATITTRWERYKDPGTGGFWWYNNETEQHFFEADPGPWMQYIADEVSKRKWWWNSETEDYFFEPEMRAAG